MCHEYVLGPQASATGSGQRVCALNNTNGARQGIVAGVKNSAGSARIKRIYELPSKQDGARVLVDRLWPRGVSKKSAALTLWLKEVAPSTSLRQWFGHSPERWSEFRRRYRAELEENQASVDRLRAMLGPTTLTLLYAAHDPERNHARVLAEYLNGPGRPRAGAAATPRRRAKRSGTSRPSGGVSGAPRSRARR